MDQKISSQRRFFYYLTGCQLENCYFVYDIAADKSTLFIPPIDPEDVIWSGLPLSPAEALEQYDVDEVKFTTDVNPTLAHLGSCEASKSTVYAIADQVSEHITFLGFDEKNFSLLREAIEVCRVVKDDYELALMQKANNISAVAHKLVLERVRNAQNEQELEAVFLGASVSQGAKNQAYSSIVASGRAAATLHYVRNDMPLKGKLNLLLDAGAEWNCYASDIVC